MASTNAHSLISLPILVFEKILLYLSYNEVAQLRIVSRLFNSTCGSLLNKGFRNVEKFHAKFLREVKDKLPRRESERKEHKLSRHCDILTAVETRISLLAMTFLKYIDVNICCFIPGKVIDEILSVLRCVKDAESPPRAFLLLTELRDLSSMAIEHFDEKIVPTFKLPSTPVKLDWMGCQVDSTPLSSFSSQRHLMPLSEPHRSSRTRSSGEIAFSGTVTSPKIRNNDSKVILTLKKKVNLQNKKVVELERKVDQQDLLIYQQNKRLGEQEEALQEIRRTLVLISGGVKRKGEMVDGSVNKKIKYSDDE